MDELNAQLEKLAAQNESLFRQNTELNQGRLADKPHAGPSFSEAQQPSPAPAA